MEKVKEPGTIISLGTAMGMVLASFYFFNRLTTIQTELDGVKKDVSDLKTAITNVNSRVASYVTTAKKNSIDCKKLVQKYQSLSQDFAEGGISGKRGKNVKKGKKKEVDFSDEENSDDDYEDENDKELRNLGPSLDRAFARQA